MHKSFAGVPAVKGHRVFKKLCNGEFMNREEDLYVVESSKGVSQFLADFAATLQANDFVINNIDTMDMKKTLASHGSEMPEDFDLHMIQLCKPSKAGKSLAMNLERAIFMPKFVMVFSKEGKTQVRYLSYGSADISAFVVDDPAFADSVGDSFAKIRSMIDESK